MTLENCKKLLAHYKSVVNFVNTETHKISNTARLMAKNNVVEMEKHIILKTKNLKEKGLLK